MLSIEKYSIGIGDRFAHQGQAQLHACARAAEQGVSIVPVWNKSHREHLTIGSQPSSVRMAADAAVRATGWDKSYYVDADHINLEIVDGFIEHSDFYTIDVADAIGQPVADRDVNALVDRHPELIGTLDVPGISATLTTRRDDIARIAAKYQQAVQQAGRIYRHIAQAKGEGRFVTEISMDETDSPQTPPELLVILAAVADEQIPIQTIAPKFTGRFNKGVDYVGDVDQFATEFAQDLAVIAYAVDRYGLPANLKLSVHSGSDKFSIYAAMRRGIERFDAGLHLKTAGTTWLEELIGLAEAGGDGLALAQEIYGQALQNVDALCAPYATVIDIDRGQLPTAATVNTWSSEQFTAALRHDPQHPEFNPHLRQLLHVGYKIAARLGDRYVQMLRECESTIARNVTHNLFERHLKPIFLGD